jgi:arabinogalactan oligomer/maltooligosaccharide transport system permease protein
VRTLGEAVPALGLNTHTGLIAVYLGGALGINTYLMYGYFNTVPKEIDEAAKIDGASHIRTFFTIIIPLVAPILVIVWMITYIAVAGDYVIASALLSDPNMQTATVGLFTMINTFRSDNWGAFSAGAILSALPVVLMFLYGQKYIVGGLSAGSVK